jgi:hypothetical protein
MACQVCASPERSEIERLRLTENAPWKDISSSIPGSPAPEAIRSHFRYEHHTKRLRLVPSVEDRVEGETEIDPDLARTVHGQQRQLGAEQRKNRMLAAQIRDLETEHEELRTVRELLFGVEDRVPLAPEWMTPGRDTRAHHATPHIVLSDLHLDEVIKPGSVSGVNAFNRRIAEQRLQHVFEKAIELPRDYLAGLTYDGITVHMAGDTFSGDIHEELSRTNEATPLESLLYWLDAFVAGLRMLADEYDHVHVVSVPGNHDRTTRKPIYKGRVETSLHYLFTKFLEREFRGDARVTWDIPLSPDAYTASYGTKILTTHGDQFSGGNGIGGILVPILRGDSRKRQRQQAVNQPYDLLVMGHFHQYIVGPGVLINGSLKGYDEYAYGHNFSFETPKQALFMVTPEYGASFHMPIEVMQKKLERWSTAA